jgi:hypothetical protein
VLIRPALSYVFCDSTTNVTFCDWIDQHVEIRPPSNTALRAIIQLNVS